MSEIRMKLLEDHNAALQATLKTIKALVVELAGAGFSDGCGCCATEELEDNKLFVLILYLMEGVPDDE